MTVRRSLPTARCCLAPRQAYRDTPNPISAARTSLAPVWAGHRHPDRVVETHLEDELREGAAAALETRPLREFEEGGVIVWHLKGVAVGKLSPLNLAPHDSQEFLLPFALGLVESLQMTRDGRVGLLNSGFGVAHHGDPEV